ncbi:DUF3592 domain-containing protein [Candidatus Obscuribacterales bacterium]|nr:DUF3592 domain-containing protein [Candidatus Obscuribacterales bacterium]
MTTSVRNKDTSTLKDYLQLPLIAVFVLVSVGMVVPEAIDYMLDEKAKSWPTVNALITKCEAPITVSLKDPYFDCQIEYKYTIGDKEYSGARLSYSKRSPQLGYDMGRFEESHKPGVEVPVHVEPGNPANSVMEPVENPVNVICHLIAVAVFFSIVYFGAYPVIEEVAVSNPNDETCDTGGSTGSGTDENQRDRGESSGVDREASGGGAAAGTGVTGDGGDGGDVIAESQS